MGPKNALMYKSFGLGCCYRIGYLHLIIHFDRQFVDFVWQKQTVLLNQPYKINKMSGNLYVKWGIQIISYRPKINLTTVPAKYSYNYFSIFQTLSIFKGGQGQTLVGLL